MKYKLVVSPVAEADIEKAFEWYEERGEGLGRDFVLKARNSIKEISTRPFSYPISVGKTRRILLERFPYSVFYTVVNDVVNVTACIHQRRSPRVWKSRG